MSRERAAELEQEIWKHLPDLRALRADEFGDYPDRSEIRHSDPLSLTQLLITYHLLRAYSGQVQHFARPIATLNRLQHVRGHDRKVKPAADQQSTCPPPR